MNAPADAIEDTLSTARALLDEGRPLDAIPHYEGALQIDPDRFVARLRYAHALEIGERSHDALVQYFRAVNDAQAKGRWLSPETTAPGLRDAVLYAMNYIDVGRRALFDAALAPFRASSNSEELQRVERCLDIYLRERPPGYPDPRQKAKFLYFADLPTSAYFARELFPWYGTLEDNTAVIKNELVALLGEQGNFEPFLDIPTPELVPQYLGGEKPNWDALFFYRHGRRYDENCARCPETTRIIESLPLVRIAEHAPEICFSILTPGTHILPHHGSTNTRLVTHLPLLVPPDCALTVGGERHVWEEGRCITFDDTFEHEAWNRSNQTRAVLIVDVWNPHLTELEKRATTALIEAIRQFNRQSSVFKD
ncbi:MAG: aspartyl/asparaginyl beta-hydroxylase domain-containing protein [Rudaea sp.]